MAFLNVCGVTLLDVEHDYLKIINRYSLNCFLDQNRSSHCAHAQLMAAGTLSAYFYFLFN